MGGVDLTGLGSVFDFGSKVIDKLFPDKSEAEKAKIELLRLQQQGELSELQVRLSAILAEANSNDPWTSRARPSFLYVMYLMILASIPMGVIYAINPQIGASVAAGMQAWLAAIPEGLWAVFGAGFLGYAAARTVDKAKGGK